MDRRQASKPKFIAIFRGIAFMGLGFLQAAGILVVAIGVLGVAFTLAWIDATPRNDSRRLD